MTLPGYPYPTRGTRVLRAADMVEVVNWITPVIRMGDGEFLCPPHGTSADLTLWCAAQGIPVIDRYDAWADLLDPFLDTEFSPEVQQRTMARLAAAGFDADRVADLRARVEKAMLHRTFLSWEWVYYGLGDVLVAMKPVVWTRSARWRGFYAEAMAVAAQGCAEEVSTPAPS